MVGQRIEGLTPTRALGLARLASQSQDEALMDQSQWDLIAGRLKRIHLGRLQRLVEQKTAALGHLFVVLIHAVATDHVNLAVCCLLHREFMGQTTALDRHFLEFAFFGVKQEDVACVRLQVKHIVSLAGPP